MQSPARRRLLIVSVPLIALAAFIASCGGDSSTNPPDGSFTGTIHILDNRFSPSSVTIVVGDSVTWRWEGSNAHTVTQGTTPDPSQDASRLFDTPQKTTGTFGFRFTTARSVPYFCRPHFSAGMKGTITVNNP